MPERIDAHHHLWRYSREEYAWIGTGMENIARDFLPANLQTEMAQCGIDGSVVVQARQSPAETDWLLGLAAESKLLRAVVGWAPSADDSFRETLDRLKGQRKLKGLRHIVQAEP